MTYWLTVELDIEADNYDEAMDLLIKQFENIKKGLFAESLIKGLDGKIEFGSKK